MAVIVSALRVLGGEAVLDALVLELHRSDRHVLRLLASARREGRVVRVVACSPLDLDADDIRRQPPVAPTFRLQTVG